MNKGTIVEGTIGFVRNGHAYLNVDNQIDDLFIHKNNTGQALNGDRVKVSVIEDKSGKGKGIQGIVNEVSERKKVDFSGVIDINKEKGFAFVRTSGGKIPVDFYIPMEHINGANDGDIVVVKLHRWYKKDKSPKGIVTKVLGAAETHETEMGNIMFKHCIDYSFSEAVEKETNDIPIEIPEKEILKRRDMRDTFSFSIDGEDAKDLDDVLSFFRLDNGNFEIGVHIADVSFYVKPGSELDKEAFSRATSIYLVDRCIPMLPEKLSNEICSLHPGGDKLCSSVIFEIDRDSLKVLNHKFKKTIINSNKRLSYNEVQKIIEENKDSICKFELEQTSIIKDAILNINLIAKSLRKERFEYGAITFDRKEVKFELDETGFSVSVNCYENKDSHKLIEEWMLLANKTVATFLYKNKIPAVFRNHDNPNTERLVDLSNFVKTFGYEFDSEGNSKKVKDSLNKLLVNVKGTSEESMISTLAIKCMSKAECGSINIGHYGLGNSFMPPNAYAWFTSPIRRYADLCNHRQLFGFLNKGK